MALKSFGAEGGALRSSDFFLLRLEQRHILIPPENMSVVLYINRHGGVHSIPLFKQAARLLLWADLHLLSIRAAHIPGCLNRGVDMFSREGLSHGEWRLHPNSVRLIWDRVWKAEVDLFTTSLMRSDTLTVRWPDVRLYAFPLLKLSPLVLCKIREEMASVILVAPF